MECSGLLLLLLLGATLTSSQAEEPPGRSRRDDRQLPVPATYVVTEVAAAQQQLQLDGAGVSIAVMDTGINYRHPVFGGCEELGKGSSCRVVGGWDHMGDVEPGDLVGGLALAAPNSDPMECSLNATHGTQVASVAAGDASYDRKSPWRGVAYASKLLAYKVTGGCKSRPGAVSTVATLQAIQRATDDDAAEVLNLSWGDFRTGGYPNVNYSAVLLSAMKQGALISMAAGNNGLMGPFFTEGGVAADSMLSVASVDVLVHFIDTTLQFDVQVGKKWQRIQALGAFGPTLPAPTNMLAVDQLALKYATLKVPANIVPVSPATACSPLSTPKAMLRGQIALVKRGMCFFKDKVAAAAAAGAAAVIIYDPASPADDPFLQMDLKEMPAIPVWGLPPAETKALLAAMAPPAGRKHSSSKQQAGATRRVRLVAAPTAQPKPYTIIVKPSAFSSWGPSAALNMLPSIAAPGSNLIVATGADKFTDIEGTSYSSPFVAGALALWRQAYQGRLPAAQLAAQLAAQAGTTGATGAAAGGSSTTASGAVGSGVPPPGSLKVEGNSQVKASSPASVPGAKVAQPQSHQRRPLQAAALAATHTGGSKSNSRAARAQPAVAGGAAGSRVVAGITLQQAAYSAFVSTAKPVEWLKVKGWAQPLARVGAGLIQVDAAILNPTVINPTHLLLRSNQVSQTLSVKVTNTAPFAVSYALSHLPAAAVSLEDLWFEGDQEDLLQPVAASVRFSLQGKPAAKLTLAARQELTLQVTLTAPGQLRAKPYVYSGYITLVPQARTGQQHSDLPPAQQVKPVPLVLPYQGFSQNYTTMPMLPPTDTHTYPKEIQDLQGLLHVCYASYDVRSAFDAPPTVADSATSTPPEVQDGSLGRKQVDACQHSRAHRQEVTQIHLDDIKAGRGVVMLSVALLRPALRMYLMLYDTDECGRSAAGRGKDASVVREGGRGLLGDCRPGAVVGGFKKLVGEVWRYNTPSRDYPGSLYAYYASSFKGNVTIRDPKTEKVIGSRPVQRGKMYRMRVYVVAPLAVADRAAGEQYKTWNFDIPGGFKFV